VIKTTDAKNNVISETVYNSLNQPLTVTDAMGKVTTYTYNEIGKVERVTDSLNHRTEDSERSSPERVGPWGVERLLVHNMNCEPVSISYYVEHSPSPSGVSLVRFFPLLERNEH